jgi:hypothetical protein
MKATITTRKPCDKLKVGDFLAFPIWEFALDEEDIPGRDETWVRPVEGGVVPKGAFSQFVAATFTTATGKKLNGFMMVTTADQQVDIDQPMVLARLGYRTIPIKSPDKWAVEERKKFLYAMGQPESNVFPIKFALLVMIQGEKIARHGTLD